MAKKVIQMYDKYKSTTKIYPKVIKECFQEDAQEYIEGQVVANPELAGTEAGLTGLEVGGTKYKVEQPINVEANPTLAGTEAELEGIEIGDTKYKIGGGKQLYQHLVSIYNANFTVTITIINDVATQFNFTTLHAYIKGLGYYYNSTVNSQTGNFNPMFPVNGIKYQTGAIVGAYIDSSSDYFKVFLYNGGTDNLYNSFPLQDVVISL